MFDFAVLLPAGLFLIMVAVGLGMRLPDFTALGDRKLALGLGLAAQIFGLPAAAFAIAGITGLQPEMAVGLVIVAAAPGGVTSNFLTLMARGDVALSIAMTAVTSLLSTLTVPVVVGFAVAHFLGGSETIRLPLGMTVGSVVVITAVPLILGMTLRAKLPDFSVRILPAARKAAALIFASIVVYTFWGQWDAIERHWRSVGPAVVLLNVLALAGGLAIGRATRLDVRQSIAIAVECGLQNVALALFVAVGILAAPELAIPAMIYAIVMNISILMMIAIGRRLVPEGETAIR